jgi:hypothetical protein
MCKTVLCTDINKPVTVLSVGNRLYVHNNRPFHTSEDIELPLTLDVETGYATHAASNRMSINVTYPGDKAAAART